MNMLRRFADHRLPPADEKRPPAPQHDGRRDHELEEGKPPGRDHAHERKTGNEVAHREHDQRQGEHRADPEPSRHVRELGILLLFEGRPNGLERHAADRARARPAAADLRVHRAGVEAALVTFAADPSPPTKLRGDCRNFARQCSRAEEVRLTRVVFPDRGIRGHLHSAHGVDLSWLRPEIWRPRSPSA